MEQLKGNLIKVDYEKKILHQELETIRVEYAEMKSFKEKYLDQVR